MSELKIMANTQAMGQTELKLKIKEAETCYSMGMIKDALNVYEEILSGPKLKDNQINETIRQKISQLRKEGADQEEAESHGMSAEDISLFKKTLSTSEDVPTILDGARALKELGLLEEAITEYEKLLAFDFSKSDYSKFDYSPAKIIQDYLTCISETKPPQEVVKQAYKIIYNHTLKDPEIAQLKFWLGTEMERKAQNELALELYKKGSEIDPNNNEIIDKLKSLTSRISSSSRYDYLLSNKMVTTQQLQEALAISKKINKSVEFVLIDRFKVNKDELGNSLAAFYGCPFRSFDMEMQVPFELINKLKKSFLLHYVWVPLGWDKTGIEILVDDPKDLRKTDHIRALMTNQKINFSVGIKEDIEKYIDHFFDPKSEKIADNVFENLDDIIPDISFEEEEEIEDDTSVIDESSSQVVKFVDQVLVTAFRNNVSDIHIEPLQDALKIRYRVDGVLYDMLSPPKHVQSTLTSRIKIMAQMNIAEKRLPQDGRIEIKIGNKNIDIRASTIPTAFGERLVLRLLDKTHVLLSVSDLGMPKDRLKQFDALIRSAYGIVLVTGPTGSGKTTTLYAALSTINTTDINIITIEDPIEYQIDGIGQIQVNPKIELTFAKGLRSIVRQDPDVILVGEVRDLETATIAIQSALTGHLVFSTLHTNDAASAVTRLIDMGIAPFLVTSSVLAILAQRLVRVICPGCKEAYTPDEESLQNVGLTLQMLQGRKIYRGRGCPSCLHTGYTGRSGIFELMHLTDSVRNLILKTSDANAIKQKALEQGMITLRQDGAQKVLDGVTTIEEVFRVTQQ